MPLRCCGFGNTIPAPEGVSSLASVFLSYARDDAARIRALARALEQAGHRVWWDERIGGGAEFSGEIESALADADVVIVAWSQSARESHWVRDEAAIGRDSGRLVPVTLDSNPPPLGFRQFQAIDLSAWKGRGRSPALQKLFEAICAKAAASPAADGQVERLASEPKHKRSFGPPRGIALAVLVLFAVAVTGAGLLFFRPGAASSRPALAVMPFADLSPAHDKAYFSQGVAEEILTRLASDQKIRVLGQISSWQFGDHPDDLGKLRKALGATHVLEGSTRTAGNQLRMDVRLVRTSDGTELWADEYQGALSDVFGAQDRIARAVADHLSGSLGGMRTAGQNTDINAYQLYLAARALTRDQKPAQLRQALQLSQKVIALDPNYAPGQALYAQLMWMLSGEDVGDIVTQQARTLALPHAKLAIRLAPAAPEGYVALGLWSSPESAIAAFKRAIALDPSRGDARVWLGLAYNALGRNIEALDQYRAAAEIEPLWPPATQKLVETLAASGRIDDASKTVDQFVSRGGSKAQAERFRSAISARQGDLSGMIMHLRAALALDPDLPIRFRLSHEYNVLGLHDLASQVAQPGKAESLYLLLYQGQRQKLLDTVRKAGPAVWDASDQDLDAATFALQSSRDWPRLVALYDSRPAYRANFCSQLPWIDIEFVQALRFAGRTADSERMERCEENWLARQTAEPIGNPDLTVGLLDFERASLLAVKGDRAGALQIIDRAIGNGWRGFSSSNLSDYSAFDSIRSTPQFQAAQARLNRIIAEERQEVLTDEARR